MSIVLDALKKAQRDRERGGDLNNDPLLTGIPGKRNSENPHGGKNGRFSSRGFLVGCFVFFIILFTIIISGGYFLIKSGRLSKNKASAENNPKPKIYNKKNLQSGGNKEKHNVMQEKKHTETVNAGEIEAVVTPVETLRPVEMSTPVIPPMNPVITKIRFVNENKTIRKTTLAKVFPKASPTPIPTPTPEPTPTPYRPEFQNPSELGLKLDGVMWDETKPEVVVNNRILGVGGVVNKMRITKITMDHIEMQKDGVLYKFRF